MGMLPCHYSEPQAWKHEEQSVAVCYGLFCFVSSDPFMQQLIVPLLSLRVG